jgi:hypothetical protein
LGEGWKIFVRNKMKITTHFVKGTVKHFLFRREECIFFKNNFGGE